MFTGERFEKDLEQLHLDLPAQQAVEYLNRRRLIQIVKRFRGFGFRRSVGAQRQQAEGRYLLMDSRAKAIVDHQYLSIPLLFVSLEELYRQFPGLLIGHLTHEQVSVGRAQVDAAIRQKIASFPPDSDHIDRGIP